MCLLLAQRANLVPGEFGRRRDLRVGESTRAEEDRRIDGMNLMQIPSGDCKEP